MEDVFYKTSRGRVHCRESGRGQRLLLMHSNGRSAYEFDTLAEAIGDRLRVVAWDMPGHGDSDRVTTHMSVSDLAALAVEIGARDGEKPFVGGSSIGATIALAAGALHPDAVAGLVVIELPISRDGRWWRDNWPLVETMFGCPEEPAELVSRRYRTVPPELMTRLRIDRHKAGGHAMMQVLWAGRADADKTRSRIADLRVPALFLNGDKGLATDAAALLSELNPAARLAVVPDSGHFPQTDDPQSSAEAIAAFVNGQPELGGGS